MAAEKGNPLGMIKDPYAGDGFVLPDTLCTGERRIFFRRVKEIISFLTITELALKECKTKYETLLSNKGLQSNTPLKFDSSDGRSTIMPVGKFLAGCNEGVEFLCRQVFVMLYGSWETYLFELLERSLPKANISENVLEESLRIMMKGNWDGKFCRMRDLLGIEYKAGELAQAFLGFEMNFGGKVYINPFDFLDALSQVRHRIVHASSILKNNKPIFINAKIFPAYFMFLSRLTEYVDAGFLLHRCREEDSDASRVLQEDRYNPVQRACHGPTADEGD